MSELQRFTSLGWKNLSLGFDKDSDIHIFGKGQMRMIFDKRSATFIGDPFNVDFRLTSQANIGKSTPKDGFEEGDFPEIKTGALFHSNATIINCADSVSDDAKRRKAVATFVENNPVEIDPGSNDSKKDDASASVFDWVDQRDAEEFMKELKIL